MGSVKLHVLMGRRGKQLIGHSLSFQCSVVVVGIHIRSIHDLRSKKSSLSFPCLYFKHILWFMKFLKVRFFFLNFLHESLHLPKFWTHCISIFADGVDIRFFLSHENSNGCLFKICNDNSLQIVLLFALFLWLYFVDTCPNSPNNAASRLSQAFACFNVQ